jgi:hypothetical protein
VAHPLCVSCAFHCTAPAHSHPLARAHTQAHAPRPRPRTHGIPGRFCQRAATTDRADGRTHLLLRASRSFRLFPRAVRLCQPTHPFPAPGTGTPTSSAACSLLRVVRCALSGKYLLCRRPPGPTCIACASDDRATPRRLRVFTRAHNHCAAAHAIGAFHSARDNRALQVGSAVPFGVCVRPSGGRRSCVRLPIHIVCARKHVCVCGWVGGWVGGRDGWVGRVVDACVCACACMHESAPA